MRARKTGVLKAGLLVAEKRRTLRPEVLARLVGLERGQRLLDFGCGPGALTLPLASRLAPSGVVVACDVQSAMIELLEARLFGRALPVVPVVVPEVRLPFPARFFDRALAVNVLGELADPLGSLRELRRVLRPGGRLLLADWLPGRPGAPDGPLVPPGRAYVLLREARFAVRTRAGPGPCHFAFVAEPLPDASNPG